MGVYRTKSEITGSSIFPSELIREILSWLPARSLRRLKSTCKEWKSIIEDPYFRRLHSLRHPNPKVSSFLVRQATCNLEFRSHLVPYSLCPSICVLNTDIDGFEVISSCNGILLCWDEFCERYFATNPTTSETKILPKIVTGSRVFGLSLAFDRSYNNYKVVCVVKTWLRNYQILIYSPGAKGWRKSGDLFSLPDIPFKDFYDAVIWNGTIHWIHDITKLKFTAFNVEKECLIKMPKPSVPVPDPVQVHGKYLGASNGRLLLAQEISYFANSLHVYEMEIDYSSWNLKYSVDTNSIMRNLSPLMKEIRSSCSCKRMLPYVYRVHHIETDETKFNGESILFGVSHKLIYYNVHGESMETAYENCDDDIDLKSIEFGFLSQFDVFPYHASVINPNV